MNSTLQPNQSKGEEDLKFGPTFGAFLFVILLAVVLVLVMDVFMLVLLARTHSVAKLIRTFLSNILAAGLFSASFGVAFCTTGIVLIFTDREIRNNSTAIADSRTIANSAVGLGFCRFLVWGYGVSAIVRLYSLAAFSVAVLCIVRDHETTLRPTCTVLLLAATWTIPALLNTHILVRQFYEVQYYRGAACFPKTLDADIILEARYTFTAIWITIGGCLPLLVSAIIPAAILCYIRRRALPGGSRLFAKGIARLALFLLVGNFINFMSQAVVGILVYHSQVSSVYFTYGFGYMTQICTPIMIALFLKPIRLKIFNAFRRVRLLSASSASSSSTSARRHTMRMQMKAVDQATLLRHQC